MTEGEPIEGKPIEGKPTRRRAGARRKRPSAAAALATALGLLLTGVGTAIAFEQARLGSLQNQASEEQSLVSLVVNLAQVREMEGTATRGTIGALHEAGAADADQGIVLVDELHDKVPAIDDLELGAAFEAYGAWHEALVSFARASSSIGGDPVYGSKALRAAAAINYYIGGRSHDLAAQADTARAERAFDGQPDVPTVERNQNEALAELWDAIFGAASDCARADGELTQASQLIVAAPATKDSAVLQDLGYAQEAVRACVHRRAVPTRRPTVPSS